MGVLWLKFVDRSWRDERGFTLSEMLVVVAILGILIIIAVVIWLGILENRRVDAATNQLAADMRLAHASAANQLTDWRVVLDPEHGNAEPDYHMARLAAPYPGPTAAVVESKPRYFPGNVKIKNINGKLDAAEGWAVDPSKPGVTRTLEFNSDGAMIFRGGVSGSTCVTADGDPANMITVLAATSRVKIKEDEC